MREFMAPALAALLAISSLSAEAGEKITKTKTVSIEAKWNWEGHRPRQGGELEAMGMEALKKEAKRLVDEWNSSPSGVVKHKLGLVEFVENRDVHNNYHRNRLKGDRNSNAGGTAVGRMTVELIIDIGD